MQSNEATIVVNELFSPQSIHSPRPLGLNLTKSPSFLELIQKKLARAAKVKRTQATENVPCYGPVHSKSAATEGMEPSTKIQASNFQASFLRIGDWEWKSRYQGDLVAKFYFAKSKVAWEMLHEGLKKKIEMRFSDICALRISCPKHLPATLDIMVSEAPEFFTETTPRPYKSTSWLHTTDFTGGQARILRRHVLLCDPGIMDKHVENLLSADHRLYLLSQENNINPGSPFLGTFCSVPEMPLSSSHGISYGSDDDNLLGTEKTGESFPLHATPMGKTTVGLNHSGALQGLLSPSTVVVGTSAIKETSGGSYQLQSDKSNWKKFFETTGVAQQPSMFNGGIMNGKGNHINNVVNSENTHSRSNPEVTRRFPGDSMTNRQVGSGGSYQLQSDKSNWKKFFETTGVAQQPSMFNGGIMNAKGNHINNVVNSENTHSRSNPEVTRRFPGDSMTNRQVESQSQSSHADHAVLYPRSEKPAEQRAPSNKDTFNWKSFLQTPRETQPSSVSNSVIMNNESGNRFNNQMNPQNPSRSDDYSSFPGEMTAWGIPDDRRTNQQVNLWNQPSYGHGLSNPNMIEQGVPQRDSSGGQTLQQNLSSNGNISLEGKTLEQMCEDLLGHDVVVNEDICLSTVNSFSCLIEQASASQSSHSQANNTLVAPPPDVEPTQVINLDTSESSGVDELFPPWMESSSLSAELSPEDMASFPELLP